MLVEVPSEVVASLDNTIRYDLQGFSHSLFVWVVVSAFAVVIGVALEGPELLHEMWPSVFTCFTGGSIPRLRRFKRIVKKVGFWGWLLIVLGVAGEGVFETLQNRAEGIMQTFNQILLTDAQRSAGSAKDSAETASSAASNAVDESNKATTSASSALNIARGARQEADSFESDIKSAKTQAAEAESHLAEALKQAANATEELNRLKSPRVLTQASRLSSELKQFAGTEYTFMSVFNDGESIDLLKQVDSALQLAGWRRVKPPPSDITLNVFGPKEDGVALGAATAVEVQVDSEMPIESLKSTPPETWPPLLQVAARLKNGLAYCITPTERNVQKDLVVTPGSSTVIRISVGKKP